MENWNDAITVTVEWNSSEYLTAYYHLDSERILKWFFIGSKTFSHRFYLTHPHIAWQLTKNLQFSVYYFQHGNASTFDMYVLAHIGTLSIEINPNFCCFLTPFERSP